MPVTSDLAVASIAEGSQSSRLSRYLAAMTVIVGVCLAQGALACSCARGVTAERLMLDAEAIFTGIAERSTVIGTNQSVTTFRVIEPFKGASPGDRLQVSHRTGPAASCGLEFADGQTSTLAVYRDEPTAGLVASVCSTWMFQPQVGIAAQLIQELRNLAGAKADAALAPGVRAYCARVGADDALRPLQSDLLDQARALFSAGSDAPADFILSSTVTRCMDGAAWLCNRGANLICEKADVSRTSPGASAYCRDNPNAGSVPMFATGHATIYSWRCAGAQAQIDRQFDTPDPRGFLSANWKRVP